MDSATYLILAASGLIAVAMLSVAALRGFTSWIEYKKIELECGRGPVNGAPSASGRIEIADVKERLRKLEAIAAGVDL